MNRKQERAVKALQSTTPVKRDPSQVKKLALKRLKALWVTSVIAPIKKTLIKHNFLRVVCDTVSERMKQYSPKVIGTIVKTTADGDEIEFLASYALRVLTRVIEFNTYLFGIRVKSERDSTMEGISRVKLQVQSMTVTLPVPKIKNERITSQIGSYTFRLDRSKDVWWFRRPRNLTEKELERYGTNAHFLYATFAEITFHCNWDRADLYFEEHVDDIDLVKGRTQEEWEEIAERAFHGYDLFSVPATIFGGSVGFDIKGAVQRAFEEGQNECEVIQVDI